MISPRVDKLLLHADSNYASVIVAAKRARQINAYYHSLGEGAFDEFAPPMVETASKNYLTIALEEVAAARSTTTTGSPSARSLHVGPRSPPPAVARPALRQAMRHSDRAMARILLGVSGSIAAYKALEFVRLATAAGHAVRVVLTSGGAQFVGADSFGALTGAPVLSGVFDEDPGWHGAYPGDEETVRTGQSGTSRSPSAPRRAAHRPRERERHRSGSRTGSLTTS